MRTGFRTWLSGAEKVRDKIPFLLCTAQIEFVIVKQHYAVNVLLNLHIWTIKQVLIPFFAIKSVIVEGWFLLKKGGGSLASPRLSKGHLKWYVIQRAAEIPCCVLGHYCYLLCSPCHLPCASTCTGSGAWSGHPHPTGNREHVHTRINSNQWDSCSLWPWVCLLLLSVTNCWDVPEQQPLGGQTECHCVLTSPRFVPYIHYPTHFSRPWLPREQISVKSQVSGHRDTQRKSLPITSLSTTPRTAWRQHAGWRKTSSAPEVRGFIITCTNRNVS